MFAKLAGPLRPISLAAAGSRRAVQSAFPKLLSLLVFLLLLGLTNAAVAEPSVTGMRVGQHPDKTRIVFDISQSVEFQIILLPDPYRLVIDLPEIEWRLDEEMAAGRDGQVQGLRYGLFQPGVSRVVMDMARPFEVQEAFLLPPGETPHYRLVIDVRRNATPRRRQARGGDRSGAWRRRSGRYRHQWSL